MKLFDLHVALRNTRLGVRLWSNHCNQRSYFRIFSGPNSTDKTHVGAEPTNLETRWALWPSPGTTPTACIPTQHDGYLSVSAEIVAGIIVLPVQVRGRYSWGPYLRASLPDTTEREYSSSSADQTPKVSFFSQRCNETLLTQFSLPSEEMQKDFFFSLGVEITITTI